MPFQALFNRFVKLLLRSPAHPLLSGNLTLLTFTGRRSGVRRTVPITYLQEGDIVNCFCNADVAWWKNLRDGAPVELRLRGRARTGTAVPVADDRAAITDALTAFLRKNRRAGRFNEVPFDPDETPNPEALARAARTRVMIRILLDP
jgi:hypothetical protein